MPTASRNGIADLRSVDPLGFVDKKPYRERLQSQNRQKTGLPEACMVGRGYMRGRPLVFGLTDSSFIMGSMGSVVGEKLTRADRSGHRAEAAARHRQRLRRRRPHARGHLFADADGQGLGCPGPLS